MTSEFHPEQLETNKNTALIKASNDAITTLTGKEVWARRGINTATALALDLAIVSLVHAHGEYAIPVAAMLPFGAAVLEMKLLEKYDLKVEGDSLLQYLRRTTAKGVVIALLAGAAVGIIGAQTTPPARAADIGPSPTATLTPSATPTETPTLTPTATSTMTPTVAPSATLSVVEAAAYNNPQLVDPHKAPMLVGTLEPQIEAKVEEERADAQKNLSLRDIVIGAVGGVLGTLGLQSLGKERRRDDES